MSTLEMMTPTKNTIDLIQFEGKINNQVINLNSKDYKANDIGFDMYDVKDTSKGTTKEDELFDYAGVPSYLKARKKSYDDKNKDDFKISL